MHIRPIKTKTDHKQAIADLRALLETNPPPKTLAAEQAEVLAILIERYEEDKFPLEKPTPIEAIKFRMDQLDMQQKDLVPYIGSASKVSEVLNLKRGLSLNMMRALHEKLGIPTDVLLAEENFSQIKKDDSQHRQMV